MKKIIMSIVMLLTLCMLTGCGKETLTCTKTEEQNGLKMDQEVITNFENFKVSDMTMIFTVNTESQYLDMMKTSMETFGKTYSDNGAKVEVVTKDDNKVIVKIKLDIKNMTDKQIKALELENMYGNKDTNKKSFEEDGYTCK